MSIIAFISASLPTIRAVDHGFPTKRYLYSPNERRKNNVCNLFLQLSANDTARRAFRSSFDYEENVTIFHNVGILKREFWKKSKNGYEILTIIILINKLITIFIVD